MEIDARLACDVDFLSFLRFRNDEFSLSSEVLLVIDLEGLFIPLVSASSGAKSQLPRRPLPKKDDRMRDSLLLTTFTGAGPAAAYM